MRTAWSVKEKSADTSGRAGDKRDERGRNWGKLGETESLGESGRVWGNPWKRVKRWASLGIPSELTS